ncbi:MAG: hypothetical protein QME25_07930 [Bacteroidota bacterium]|nr:hypothetical protein [Bacteroidota bacterium]
MLKQYLQNLFEISNRGDAREESFYGALEKLLQDFSKSINKKSTQITVPPKQTEAGNPDFRIWDGKFKFIQEHILKNFYALELMMAPYAVGHLKEANSDRTVLLFCSERFCSIKTLQQVYISKGYICRKFEWSKNS